MGIQETIGPFEKRIHTETAVVYTLSTTEREFDITLRWIHKTQWYVTLKAFHRVKSTDYWYKEFGSLEEAYQHAKGEMEQFQEKYKQMSQICVHVFAPTLHFELINDITCSIISSMLFFHKCYPL